MRCFAIAVSLCVFGASALADASCATKAAEKKLAGAALTSFMTKCEQDAAAAATRTVSRRNSRAPASTVT